jgi:hypothetical protein
MVDKPTSPARLPIPDHAAAQMPVLAPALAPVLLPVLGLLLASLVNAICLYGHL